MSAGHAESAHPSVAEIQSFDFDEVFVREAFLQPYEESLEALLIETCWLRGTEEDEIRGQDLGGARKISGVQKLTEVSGDENLGIAAHDRPP